MKHLVVGLALALAAAPATAVSVSNTAAIAIVDDDPTTSVINVSGVAGTITGMTLTLNDLSHTYPDDLVVGVINQSWGVGFFFMSGVGGSTDVNDATLTFSDAATGQLPQSFVGGGIVSGTYQPSNLGQYIFGAFGGVGAFAGFNGGTANGLWTLYVYDIFPDDTAAIAGGWSLDFTTDASAVPEPASWALMLGGFGLVGSAMRRRNAPRHVAA